MKQIIATIKPCMLDDVIFALHQVQDFPGATTSDVQGIGKGFHQSDGSHGSAGFDYPTYKRLEICCSEKLAISIIALILEKAHTGNPDDGKISVISIDDAADISSEKHLTDE